MISNLEKLWNQRDAVDHAEGLLAYRRYRKVMVSFADRYCFPLKDTVSAFVALSPNSDYYGNLRSLATVMNGVANGAPVDQITVSTYNACRDRAYKYLTGESDFLKTVKGLKTRSFRDNILRPNTSKEVTVDGHMIAAWRGKSLTMREAARLMKNKRQYFEIRDGIAELAENNNVAPCQCQAILWLTRKRVNTIKYSAQLELFGNMSDQHKTIHHAKDILPYD